MKDKLFLIDGTALIYRAYFAFLRNPLINSKGVNTSAIYGVINSFLKIVEEYKPQYVMVSFDRKEKTFRHEMDDSYKANRPPMPDDLVGQIEPVKEFFKLINIPEISLAGYEADDIIGTFAEHFKDKTEVYIVSGDKDFSQIVQDHVYLLDPFKNSLLDQKGIKEKYGVEASQFINYLAIVGDSADNIPGVKGLGAKAAEKLLSEYRDLDEIYANLDSQKGATLKKLTEQKESAYHSYELAKINLHVPLAIPELETLVCCLDNSTNLNAYFNEYELNTLKNKLMKVIPLEDNSKEQNEAKQTVSTSNEEHYEQATLFANDVSPVANKNSNSPRKEEAKFDAILITSLDHLNQVLTANKEDYLALDTETTSLDTQDADLVGISFSYNEQTSYYVPLNHFASDNLPVKQVLDLLEKHIVGKLIIGHNLKYDFKIFEYHGLKFDNSLFDTMIASFLLDPTNDGNSLDKCMERELDYTMQPIEDLIGKGKDQKSFALVSIQDATFYAAEDAWASLRLYSLYKERLKQQGLHNLFTDIEIPLIYSIKKMEMNGAYIDKNFLKNLSEEVKEKINTLASEIYNMAGYQFNLNSTQQLAKLLFEDMEIPPVKKTKTGYSTDVTVLETLAEDYEIVKLMLEYRQLAKLDSTYISALPKLVNDKTKRIHSNFNQIGASTGRLSSTNPNLQNIPIRTEIGSKIREAFVPQDEDSVILAADYSQIELRLLAIFSGDSALINTFRENGDIHRSTAALIFNKTANEITGEERRSAKTINFGIIYGMGAQKLSKELNITQKEAKEFITHYFETFPTIKNFMNTMVKKAKSLGYCETISGRKLFLPGIRSSNQRLISEAERVAVNMPIQGSAADVIKIAMNNLHAKIKDNPDIKMIIQVHDELVFEVKKSSLDEMKKLIKNEMENALPHEYSKVVKLLVDIGIGNNWLQAH
ncbi:DNA polymerase I [bacterium]|nr:DNA polymerase I [bacterium]